MLSVGDVVKVLGCLTGDPLAVPVGTDATVCGIWDGLDYPLELLGFSEGVRLDEVELVA